MTPRQRLHAATIKMVEGINPRLFLTLAVGSSADPMASGGKVTELLKRIEHRAHGKNWSKYPDHLRLRAYAFLEKPESYPHWHTVFAGPPEIEEAAIKGGLLLWSQIVKNGHGHIAAIKSREAVSRYVTKGLYAEWSFDNFVAYGPGVKS